MEHGTHIEVPLPSSAEVSTYTDEWGEWVDVRCGAININPWGYSGEYSLNPPPDTDTVFADLVSAGASHEDAKQIVDHMAAAGWAI